MGEMLARQAQATDTFSDFIDDRLVGSLRRRIVGVVFIVIGAALALAGDLLSTVW